MLEAQSPEPERTERLARQMADAIATVANAKPFAKNLYQGRVYDLVVRLLKEPGGAEAMYALAPRFDDAGLFYGGDWASPEILQPALVSPSLRGAAFYVAIEALSELRMLAIALGDYTHPEMSPEAARAFLEEVFARNIDFLFPDTSETGRSGAAGLRRGVEALFEFIGSKLGYDGILTSVVQEADRVLLQRPILVSRVKQVLRRIGQSSLDNMELRVRERAHRLLGAMEGPGPLSAAHHNLEAYAEAFAAADEEKRLVEIRTLGMAMRDTGLVCPQHALALRHIAQEQPALIPEALFLDSVGRESFAAYTSLVQALIAEGVHPQTCQAALGLACMLERGILFSPPVAPGLWRHLRLQVLPEVATILENEYGPDIGGRKVLIGGILNVLGQPLGVGQGKNPTCQSARAISLWAQHDIPFLLELIAWAARDDELDMHFEGQHIVSSHLADGLAPELHSELDPVSLVLVPHLDRVYAEMGRRVAGRGEDGHKWINPEFHGWWVSRGFAIVVNVLTGFIRDFDCFIRVFYAAYHPYYNGNRPVIHPQPAGIAATNAYGAFIGWHAVSIQRVMLDKDNVMRVYFYNPNNDGGQNWGQGIQTSTHGHGEFPGESSLPFDEFASRIYVFHFGWRELGDAADGPAEEVRAVRERARSSWAAEMPWDDTPHDYLAEYAHVNVHPD